MYGQIQSLPTAASYTAFGRKLELYSIGIVYMASPVLICYFAFLHYNFLFSLFFRNVYYLLSRPATAILPFFLKAIQRGFPHCCYTFFDLIVEVTCCYCLQNLQEELMRGKPGYEHLNEALHLVIEAELPAELIDIRLMQAREILDDMLKPVVG